jgi:iron complex outermembrane receptor protein
VDTPEILLKSELTYDNGAFFASANVNYTDERFYTYLNQGSVDAYSLVNLAAGYRFRGFGAFGTAVDPARRHQRHRQAVLQHHRLQRLHRNRPQWHLAIPPAGRATAVLPVGESEF